LLQREEIPPPTSAREIPDGPVGAGQIQRRPPDVPEPGVASFGEPPARLHGAATRNNVEERASLDVDDRGRPRLATPPPQPAEQGLVQAERDRLADPVRVFDERDAVGEHGVVDRVPVTAQLDGDLVHGPAVPAHLFGHPSAGTIGHPEPGRGDRRMLTGPGADREHDRLGQLHRCLRQMSRARRPNTARSTSSTAGRS
jgi:hypothetical protein